jgi:PIN domain nuclease of toxin-antitoxin system
MLLLDTHAFLWFLSDDSRLPSEVCKIIQSDEDVYISIASFWEIAIKSSLGKLQIPKSVSQIMEDCVQNSFKILEIHGKHLERLKDLPWYHRDPFDRLLICQAKEEGLTLVTADGNIQRYDIETLWG